jgi:hypothetical protein
LTLGSLADISTLENHALDLPPSSTIYADHSYNDYSFENELRETEGLGSQPLHKKNSKRPNPP